MEKRKMMLVAFNNTHPSHLGHESPSNRLPELATADNTARVPIGTTLQEAAWILVQMTLESVRDNKSKAARILGISRKTLYNMLKQRRSENDSNGNATLTLPSQLQHSSD